MTTLVTIDVLNPDSTPWAYATVAVRLVDAGAGGVTTPGVIAGTQRVRCDSAGHAEIALTPNASITPANTFYAFTVERSSPSVTRKITVPVSPSEIDWDDGAYQVITDTPPVYFPAATSGDVGDVPRVNATGDGYELAAPSGGAGSVADDTHAATSKTTPVNADELPLVDSAASFGLKKLTWANLKATLKTYFDTLYPSGSGTSTGTNTGDQTLPTLSSLGAVPTSRTLAGLDLSADRTASALRTALGLVIGTDVLAPNGSGASLTGIPESAVTNLVTDLAAKAPLASPTFTGTPAAPTASAGTATTQVATTAFVSTLVQPRGRVTGAYVHGGLSNRGGTLHNAQAAGRLIVFPTWLHAGAIDRLFVYLSVAAVSTWRLGIYPLDSALKPDGQSVLLSGGTVNMNGSPGILETTVSATIPSSGLWGMAVLVDAYTANPTVQAVSSDATTNLGVPRPWAVNGSNSTSGAYHFDNIAYMATGVTTGSGSLPSTCPAMTPTTATPLVGVRYA